jgi:hypothetical protein
MDLLTLQQTGNLYFSLARLIERKAGRIYLLKLFDASNIAGRREDLLAFELETIAFVCPPYLSEKLEIFCLFTGIKV